MKSDLISSPSKSRTTATSVRNLLTRVVKQISAKTNGGSNSNKCDRNVEERIAETREFLKRTDFMDFPGARSNIEINADSDLQMSTDQLSPADIYIRGKVSYLFDKYSQDFEINNLLFCIPCLKNEVGQLPGLLSSWINRNIGSTPADREKALVEIKTSPLMIVFTWWNIELQPYASDNQSFDIKWEIRFDEFFNVSISSLILVFSSSKDFNSKFSL